MADTAQGPLDDGGVRDAERDSHQDGREVHQVGVELLLQVRRQTGY